jgi:hypothetical protein
MRIYGSARQIKKKKKISAGAISPCLSHDSSKKLQSTNIPEFQPVHAQQVYEHQQSIHS